MRFFRTKSDANRLNFNCIPQKKLTFTIGLATTEGVLPEGPDINDRKNIIIGKDDAVQI